MKIAILGVGSFVFGPSALHDAIVEHRFTGMHLALFDPNTQAMKLMAGVARQMAAAVQLSVRITTHATLAEALQGADFVVSAAAVQVQKRFEIDSQIIAQHYPGHLITEFGGVSGISYTLRQVELIRDLTRQMRSHCPNAWLLTSSNPLPRVCEAAHRLGVRTAGFCSNSSQVLEAVGRVMLGANEHFPWPTTSARYVPEMAGVNHLTWLLSLRDMTTGEDVLASFQEKLSVSPIAKERPVSLDLMRKLGHYPPNGDTHMADFLPPTPHVRSLESSVHGNAAEREARLKLLQDVADGKANYRQAMDHRAWEKPMDFVAGVAAGQSVRLLSLNLPNDGQLPQLSKGVYVETSLRIDGGQVIPAHHILPPAIATLCGRTAQLHSLLAEAALTHDRKRLREAVELDPTILDKAKGSKALDECMKAHNDLIGTW